LNSRCASFGSVAWRIFPSSGKRSSAVCIPAHDV
jgi:hypothetical protein